MDASIFVESQVLYPDCVLSSHPYWPHIVALLSCLGARHTGSQHSHPAPLAATTNPALPATPTATCHLLISHLAFFSRHSQAHQVRGGSQAHLFGLSPRPVSLSTFGDLAGNGNGDTCVATGIHGGGGTVSAGLRSNTSYGEEAAVLLPFLSRDGGYGGNHAAAFRARRTPGATRNGRMPFVDGLFSVAKENDRTDVHVVSPSPGSMPLGSKGGDSGDGGAGSFRSCLPAFPWQEGDLKWMFEVFDEVRVLFDAVSVFCALGFYAGAVLECMRRECGRTVACIFTY